MGKWHNVDFLQRTCSCGHFQYNQVLCGHAITVIRAADRGAPRDLVPYDLTVPSLHAAYAVPMVPVEIAGLEVRYAISNRADDEAALERSPLCRSLNFKKPRGRPQTARARQVNREHVLPT